MTDCADPRRARRMQRRRRQRILTRPRDQRHRLHRIRDIQDRRGKRALRRPQHFKAELRHPVAKPAEVEVLDHHISDPPKCRRLARPLDRLDLRVRHLVLAAGIDPHIQAVRRNLHPIRPDPAHATDLATAQGHGEADRIAVAGGRGRSPLAAARRRLCLQELGGPDHLPPDPVAPPDLGHRSPIGSADQAELVNPAGLHALRAQTQQALVDHPAQRRTDSPADHRAGQPQHGAAKARADGRTGRRQKNGRHELAPQGKVSRAAIRRCQGVVSATSTTPWPE